MLPTNNCVGQHKPFYHRTNTLTITNISTRIQARDGVAVVLYSKPNCAQCKLTSNMLDKAGIVYATVDVTQDDTALAYVTGDRAYGGLGYKAAPVVYVSTIDGDIDWHGFRPDLIKKFITEIADAA